MNVYKTLNCVKLTFGFYLHVGLKTPDFCLTTAPNSEWMNERECVYYCVKCKIPYAQLKKGFLHISSLKNSGNIPTEIHKYSSWVSLNRLKNSTDKSSNLQVYNVIDHPKLAKNFQLRELTRKTFPSFPFTPEKLASTHFCILHCVRRVDLNVCSL